MPVSGPPFRTVGLVLASGPLFCTIELVLASIPIFCKLWDRACKRIQKTYLSLFRQVDLHFTHLSLCWQADLHFTHLASGPPISSLELVLAS